MQYFTYWRNITPLPISFWISNAVFHVLEKHNTTIWKLPPHSVSTFCLASTLFRPLLPPSLNPTPV
ncbi:hypothetical protein JHK82_052313 [Glycine max]|uniref:Uncharacterized protein n=2 Tax=Glycine subgen. Soja TaxID=1462606 RepID=A0A0R0EHG2_SOYBN|nr:hypothetical protein JHK85_053001 [Glycine max]RZB46228.1 hypothetical protein D0Y65_050301 [Glycine soja]KAG5082152.1 hypothetical protein JHK84_052190 [Glycine max]KAG5084916.1 hypothetical protein JHK82_052313 [Glycine max]KAH1076186.1 hypothetical protein GYH30_051881 [Glycine max]